MTNISDDRKVVLSPLREVPYEITFLLTDAKQDQSIPNRYWFDFPSQWIHQANKDPIIGIRSIYTTKTNRYISFAYNIALIDENDLQHNEYANTYEQTLLSALEPFDFIGGKISYWLDGKESLQSIIDEFNKNWLSKGRRHSNHTCTDEQHTWQQDEIHAFYNYDEERHKIELCIGRTPSEDYFRRMEIDGITHTFLYAVTIVPTSYDAEAIFDYRYKHNNEGYPYPWQGYASLPISWTRHQCLVKSSIADTDKNNILGHTRNDPYTPIKYFRLNHDLNKFWVELYETRYHECPVSFPYDLKPNPNLNLQEPFSETNPNYIPTSIKDDLIIEAIVCLSSQAML